MTPKDKAFAYCEKVYQTKLSGNYIYNDLLDIALKEQAKQIFDNLDKLDVVGHELSEEHKYIVIKRLNFDSCKNEWCNKE